MKRSFIVTLLIAILILSACSAQSSPTPQVDYQATVTSYSVDIASLTWEKQKLEEENLTLKEQISQLQQQQQPTVDPETETKIAQLEADKAALEQQLADLQAQPVGDDELLTQVSNAMITMRQIFYGGEEGDGLKILCQDAESNDFSYSSIDAMTTELKEYILSQYDVSESDLTITYDTLWKNYNDSIVHIESPNWYAPYVVIFGVEDEQTFDSVYDITNQCYLDFPKLEEKLLEVRGN
jgi:uncharacterized protein YcfL